jgi:hypothetical protein
MLEHIEPGAGDLAVPQRLLQGSFIHHAAARDIDEIAISAVGGPWIPRALVIE